MYDHHMHYPEDFQPDAPREKWDDGMVCAPGPRADCALCQSRAQALDESQAVKRRGRPVATQTPP